jgi:hypothetical protein
MVEAIFQWWIALMMLAGIGHMIESVIYSRKNRALQMGTVWFGLTGFVCLIYSFNLFTGLVGWQLKTVIVLFAPLGIWKTAKFLKVGAFPRWRPKLFDVFVGILVVVVIVLLSNWSIGSAQFGDSSLYHIGLVDYAAKYPVIPGLANLHSRFGFK